MSQKTLIGVLASYDNEHVNNALSEVLEFMYFEKFDVLSSFHFLFTGGTFDRIVLGKSIEGTDIKPLSEKAKNFYMKNSTRLPTYEEGGVHLLAYLVIQKKVGIICPFLSPVTNHVTAIEADSLMRLCDIWGTKVMINRASMLNWLRYESEFDKRKNLQEIPVKITLRGTETGLENDPKLSYFNIKETIHSCELNSEEIYKHLDNKQKTLVIVGDGKVKQKIVDFVIYNENKLSSNYEKILTTSSTGLQMKENCSSLNNKIFRYHAAKKGGLIEIATEIIFGNCDAVILISDRDTDNRLTSEDFKVVYGACQRRKDKLILSFSEFQARDWLDKSTI